MYSEFMNPCLFTALAFVSGAGVFAYLLVQSRRSRKLVQTLTSESCSKQSDSEVRIRRSQLRILCQNCWNVQWPGSELKARGRHSKQRFDALIKGVIDGGYDVVVLQELFVLRLGPFVFGEDVEYLRRKLVDIGYTYHTNIAFNLPAFFGQSAGVAIFSTLPLVGDTPFEEKYHSFSVSSLRESINCKGFVHAQIRVASPSSSNRDGEIVHFFSAHLDASSQSEIRKAQVEQISKVLHKIPPDESVVMSGDFNIDQQMWNGAVQYPHLIKAMRPLVEVFPEVKQTYRNEPAAYDHMFIGRNAGPVDLEKIVEEKSVVDLKTSRRDKLPMSDHLGLAVTLNVDAFLQ